MSNWFKRALSVISVLLIFGCTAPGSLETTSHSENTTHHTSITGISSYFSNQLGILDVSSLSLAEKRVRTASVKVTTLLNNGHGSGTYMIMYGRRVVVTAAHVVKEHTSMVVLGRDSEEVVGRVVFRDPDADIAFILVPEIDTRTAIRYNPQTNYDERLVGTSLTYTGFPEEHDLLTIRGYIASLEHNRLVTNMFGWFGASGSGVFDNHQRFMGVVSGIDIGRVRVFGMRIPLESIVWVAPISQIDHEILKARILAADQVGSRRSFPGAMVPRRGGTRD